MHTNTINNRGNNSSGNNNVNVTQSKAVLGLLKRMLTPTPLEGGSHASSLEVDNSHLSTIQDLDYDGHNSDPSNSDRSSTVAEKSPEKSNQKQDIIETGQGASDSIVNQRNAWSAATAAAGRIPLPTTTPTTLAPPTTTSYTTTNNNTTTTTNAQLQAVYKELADLRHLMEELTSQQQEQYKIEQKRLIDSLSTTYTNENKKQLLLYDDKLKLYTNNIQQQITNNTTNTTTTTNTLSNILTNTIKTESETQNLKLVSALTQTINQSIKAEIKKNMDSSLKSLKTGLDEVSFIYYMYL